MSRQVGIYKSGKQSSEPEEYVSKEYASTLVAASMARWINNSKDIRLNKTPIDTRIAAYDAHSYRIATAQMVNIPIEWLTTENAAELKNDGKAVWLGDKAIAITDRKHVELINWVRFRKMERQGHRLSPAPQLAERLVIESNHKAQTINAGWSNRAGVEFCPLIVKGDARPVATIDPRDLSEPKRVFEASYPPYPATRGLKKYRELDRFKINA